MSITKINEKTSANRTKTEAKARTSILSKKRLVGFGSYLATVAIPGDRSRERRGITSRGAGKSL